MNNSKYRGVVVPMVTPVTQDGRLDVKAVERIIEFFADNKVAPLLMGTTGEGNSVSQQDGQLMVETAVKAANGRILVYAGLTGNCFAEQVRQAEVYTALGADVIVATLPTYYALTDEQMYEYYRTLADCITGPLMLYNILATTHMSIPVDVVRRLADHPNIVGLKDSERDLERMAQCIEIARGRDDFAYFCGWAAQSAHSLELGGNGIVPSTGNYVPEMFRQLFDAAVRGDMQEANRLQDETNEIAKIYQKDRTLGQSLTALKVMMQTKGLCEPWMLMPLTRLSSDEESKIIRMIAPTSPNENIKKIPQTENDKSIILKKLESLSKSAKFGITDSNGIENRILKAVWSGASENPLVQLVSSMTTYGGNILLPEGYTSDDIGLNRLRNDINDLLIKGELKMYGFIFSVKELTYGEHIQVKNLANGHIIETFPRAWNTNNRTDALEAVRRDLENAIKKGRIAVID